ncbi:MAG: hypothetical protein ABI633_07580 [Burkholderiales bacterium]
MGFGIALDWAGVPRLIRHVRPAAAIELVLDRCAFVAWCNAAGIEPDAQPPRDICRHHETLALPQRCIVAQRG